MRRESHRRRGVYRASSGAWGHRAVYIGAVVATAAVIAGFGAALVVYGPIGTPTRQLSGTTVGIPPKGVEFGNAQQVLASGLVLTGANGFPQWNWTNATTGNFSGPCQAPGVLASNGSGLYSLDQNSSAAVNISAGGGNVTLVCLNSVNNATLNATWYGNASNGITNFYNGTNGLPDGSFVNTSLGNISSCNQWNTSAPTGLDLFNSTHQVNNASFAPCATYYQMNNNTTYVTSFGGSYSGGNYTNSTLWAPGEMGFGPNDVVYELPVVFTNASLNGTYEISVAIQGVTPVAQTFYFNDTIGGTAAASDTVLFVFDMTAAWLYDTSVVLNQTGAVVPANATTALIYGAIGITSAIITECQGAYCPLAAPEFI